MKCSIALLALIGLSLSAPSIKLEQDLLDFMELIPFEDIKILVEKHLRNDPGFQAAIQYLQGDEWEKLTDDLDKTPQMQALTKYLLQAGIDTELFVDIAEEILGAVKIKSHNSKPSMKKFLQEVNTVIPHGEIMKLFAEKLEKSTFFQDLFDKISSERFHVIVENLLSTSESQKVIEAVENLDVSIRPYAKAAYVFLGWKSSEYL